MRRLAVLRFAAAAFSDGIERAAPVDASETADGWVEAMTALPRLWLLTGHRAGDNNQLLALAEALGWPFETKHFIYRRTELLTNLLLGQNLLGMVRSRSSRLEPPWPDLVVSAGRRNEPIARWIRARSVGRALALGGRFV